MKIIAIEMIFYTSLLMVVPNSMQTEIIRTVHEKGHTGIKNKDKYIEEYYYIPCQNFKVKLRELLEDLSHKIYGFERSHCKI